MNVWRWVAEISDFHGALTALPVAPVLVAGPIPPPPPLPTGFCCPMADGSSRLKFEFMSIAWRTCAADAKRAGKLRGRGERRSVPGPETPGGCRVGVQTHVESKTWDKICDSRPSCRRGPVSRRVRERGIAAHSPISPRRSRAAMPGARSDVWPKMRPDRSRTVRGHCESAEGLNLADLKKPHWTPDKTTATRPAPTFKFPTESPRGWLVLQLRDA
ncbi:uncharacterized protein V1510DRAFT_414208 [Dipodascopsis tothii]|uniref:uncharacterized protein n=1 Tax=Dipodascopsis tothii TaxID=44089 RepID=UPI0034D01F0F